MGGSGEGDGGCIGTKTLYLATACLPYQTAALAHVNWTLGPPIKATAQKATGEKNKGNTCTHTHMHKQHTDTPPFMLSMGLH